jgi:2-polyprenyl-3-methyl-5-hydroxy-6-metoxy-1,4-benzoquinol methylase
MNTLISPPPSHHVLKDIIQWDVVSWSEILKYWEDNINWENVHTCLELGGRKGGLSLWLALKGKQTVCSDISDAKENAKTLHSRYNINSLITYQDIDATAIPYEDYFDVVVFKSIIGEAVPKPPDRDRKGGGNLVRL